jgi:hypothetical protein
MARGGTIRLGGASGAHAVEEDGGGFVIAACLAGKLGLGGNEFAAEGFSENCLRDFFDVRGSRF